MPYTVKKILLISLILILVVGALLLYLNYRARKMPANSPSRFLAEKKQKSKKKVVVCVGDSLTHGRVSFNYVDLLTWKLGHEKYELVNAGINSELAYNVLQRIDEIIRCQPDFVTILIGSNDAHAALDPEVEKRVVKKMNLPQSPTPEWFRKNLTAIVSRLKSETGAKIALLSIPPIGEDSDHAGFKISRKYSRIIKKTAAQTKTTYLPVFETMQEYLKERKLSPKFSFESRRLVMYLAIVQKYMLGRTYDKIARSNGFMILTDYLHLNSMGGGVIANLITGDFVLKK